MVPTLPLQFGIPGGPELLVILLIAVLLFGANKIPKLARSTGEAMGEFQKGREEVEQELQEMRDGVTGEGDSPGRRNEPEIETAEETEDEMEDKTEMESELDSENEESIAEADDETDDLEIAEAEAETDEETN